MAKAMILAAGQGTRVRPLTKYLPKPMIPILGKPVLEYLIEQLARYGVKEIMINVAYSHWKIESYFGNGHRWGVEIGYSFEGSRDHGEIVPKPMGSAGGMRRIQDHSGFFDDTTIVLCGDAIIDLDIGAALHEHRTKKALASVVTLEVPRDEVKNYGIVVSDADGRVTSFQEKPSPETAKLVQKRYLLDSCWGRWRVRVGSWCAISGGTSPRSAPITPASTTVRP